MEHRCPSPDVCCLSASECEENARAAAQPLKRKPGSVVIAERFPSAFALWLAGEAAQRNAFTLTAYNIGGRVVILQEFTDHRAGSWDVYVQASDSNEIEATLAAVERHLAGETEDPRAKALHDACLTYAHTVNGYAAEVDTALREKGDNATADELDAASMEWTRAGEAFLRGLDQ